MSSTFTRRRSVLHLALILGLVAGSPRASSCQATFKLATTTAIAEKGHSFEITLDVRADVAIKRLVIRASAPENFTMSPTGLDSLAGISWRTDGLVSIRAMKAGSTVSIRIACKRLVRWPRSTG